MPNKQKRLLGIKGENLACDYLKEKGYEIVERNYRYSRGEIDIIAKDEDILVFVEVKTRNNLEFGPPELAVTKGKQTQIRKIASAYLYEKEIEDTICRIDVIAILFKDEKNPKINHIENAF
jgi:putative endonuclease